ncbi:MAG: hypothetical protein HC817_12320 [Saprospiraceae bacterium]|nr:hypothetical protein [Saprospiraceae bacterium]
MKMIKTAIITALSLSLGAGIFFKPQTSLFNLGENTSTQQNAGDLEANSSPVEQARMLLRKVQMRGKCVPEPATLDSNFAARVGQACQINRDQMRAYLNQYHINEWEVGGTLDLPLSSNTDGSGNLNYARYMVIHDTSYPRYGSSLPDNINDESWEWNRLGRWVANVTHVYVNRIGDSKTTTPFHEGKTATKRERYIMGEGASKGLYLHIELIQPRKARPGYGRHNDVDAPTLGFTDAQYKRLALLYTIASVRKGEWIIPAFHACVDAGIRYAHDDPQNFELEKMFAAMNELWADIDRINSGLSK